MLTLVIGLLLFLGVHSIAMIAPAWREQMVQRNGSAWRGGYALLSLLGLILIISGYAEARLQPTVLYLPPGWLRHATITLMVPVFPLLLAAYLPGRIKATLKHPMLVAIKLWAFAHLLSNGMLADILLFGGFLAWAVANRISLKRRPVRSIKTAPATPYNDLIAIVVGLALYLLTLLWAHAKLIGVSPL